MSNVDHAEIAKFEALAHRWWDRESEFKPAARHQPAAGQLDRRARGPGRQEGAGRRLRRRHPQRSHGPAWRQRHRHRHGRGTMAVAQLHQLESGVEVEYRRITAEEMAEEMAGQFDVVTCLEMLEHVPDPPR